MDSAARLDEACEAADSLPDAAGLAEEGDYPPPEPGPLRLHAEGDDEKKRRWARRPPRR